MFGRCDVSTGSETRRVGGARVSSRCSFARAVKADVVDDAFLWSAAAAARVRDHRPFFLLFRALVVPRSRARRPDAGGAPLGQRLLRHELGQVLRAHSSGTAAAAAAARVGRLEVDAEEGQRQARVLRLGRFVILMISSTRGEASPAGHYYLGRTKVRCKIRAGRRIDAVVALNPLLRWQKSQHFIFST